MRALLGLLVGGCVMLINSATLLAAQNLLIITVDDMSCDSVGVYGCPLVGTTPHMDSLAKTALRFEKAHVQVGNCMPSRNVMWSGKYPHNNGVEGFYQVRPIGYPVLCDLAQQAGYFTAIRHKVSHSTPYAPYAWDLDLDKATTGAAPHVKDAASYGRSTTQGIDAAREASKPFCLLINVADPHKPFYGEVKGGADPHVPTAVYSAAEVPVPGFLPDDPVIRQELARYYSSVRRADDAVGEILTALKRSGQEEQTVVVFLSDHGMPLPFAKTQLYHHSTRTPLMVRWPGVTRPGSVDEQHMVSAVDLLPTVLEILELPQPAELDGRSLVPLLRGQSQANREFVVKEYNENSGGKRNPMRAIQTSEYLYIFNPWSDGQRPMATATNGTDTYRRMKQLANSDPAIAERVKLADYRVVEELYHVATDPDCLHNLITDSAHQQAADMLRADLSKWMEQTGDPMLEVLDQRASAEFLTAFMKQQQGAADERRAGAPAKKKANARRQAAKTE
jgi:N-sulfoglucosamine sulfohydrolase